MWTVCIGPRGRVCDSHPHLVHGHYHKSVQIFVRIIFFKPLEQILSNSDPVRGCDLFEEDVFKTDKCV